MKRKLGIFACSAAALLASAFAANAQIALVTSTNVNRLGPSLATNNWTWTNFAMNGGNAVVVALTFETVAGLTNYTITYGAQALTPGPVGIDTGAGAQTAAIYYLLNPSNSVADLSISLGVNDGFAASAVSLANVASIGVSNTAGAGSTTSLTLTYASGDYIVAGIMDNSSSAAPTISGANTPFTTLLSVNGSSNTDGGAAHWAGTLSTVPGTNTITISSGSTRNAAALMTFNATILPSLFWAVGNGNWDINTTANWTNPVAGGPLVNYQAGNLVTFNDSASGSSPINITLNTNVSPTSMTVSNSTKNYAFSGTGSINGGITLVKRGSGTLTLGTANAYSGGTALNGGTTVFSSLNNLGSGAITFGGGTLQFGAVVDISSRTVTFGAGGATLDVGANNITFASPVGNGGAGGLTKKGSGTLELRGKNIYTGNTLVEAGTLSLDAVIQNAAISNSPVVTINSGATLDAASFEFTLNGSIGQKLAGIGTVTASGNGLVAPTGSFVSPATNGVVGTLSVTGPVTLSGGTLQMDVSTSSNDKIAASGTVYLSGGGIVAVNVVGAPLTNGNYTLMTSSFISGSAASLGVSGFSQVGQTATLSNTPTSLLLVVSGLSTNNLTWAGANANWDVGSTMSWSNGPALDVFRQGDTVTFNNSGSAQPNVSLNAEVFPNSVTVNATTAYSISGGGSIAGDTTLTKSGSGTLSISSINTFNGKTTVNGGVLSIFADSALGANPAVQTDDQLTLNGGTLSVPSSFTTATRRGISAGTSGGTISVDGFQTLTHASRLGGTNTLTKVGAGTLALTVNSSGFYTGRTIIQNGTVQVITQDGALGGDNGGIVELQGGTLEMADNFTDVKNPVFVDAGQSGTIVLPNNNADIDGNLTGSGTLNLTAPSVLNRWSANPSAFTGTINITGGGANLRLMRTGGGPSAAATAFNDFGIATVNLTNVTLVVNTAGGDNNLSMGALSGDSNSGLGGLTNTSGNAIWHIGAAGTSTSFAGSITPGNGSSRTHLDKVGAGTLTLSGPNTARGGLTVGGGTLALSGSATPSTMSPITISNNAILNVTGLGTLTLGTSTNQTLAGSGAVVGNVVIDSIGTVSPGASYGTLTLSNGLTLNNASSLAFELSSTSTNAGGGSNDLLRVNGALSLAGGSGTVTFVPSFPDGPPILGQAYTIITYGGALTGGPANLALDPVVFGYSHLVATFTTNTPGAIKVTFTASPVNLVWQGNSTNMWEAGPTANWLSGATLTNFYQYDNATFNDSASNFVVSLKGSVLASSVVVSNSANDYDFTNDLSGTLGGSMSLVKQGSGKLTLRQNNSYLGSTTVSGGGTLDIGGSGGALGSGPLNLNRATFRTTYNGTVPLGIVFGSGTTNILQADGSANTVFRDLSGGGSGAQITFQSDTSPKGPDFDGTNTFAGTFKWANNWYLRLRSETSGNASAVWDLADVGGRLASVINDAPGTFNLGALSGGVTSRLQGHLGSGGNSNAVSTYVIGALNQTTTFAGIVEDGTKPEEGAITAITKVGTGTLTLSGTNTYTGPTTVSNGTLSITVPYLSSATNVVIASPGVLNLNFVGTNVVKGIVTNGVSLAAGIYNAGNLSPRLTGTGSLQIPSAGGPIATTLTNSVVGGTNLMLSWPAGQGWRLQQQITNRAVGLNTNWLFITDSSVSSTNITINKANGAVFYRLVYP